MADDDPVSFFHAFEKRQVYLRDYAGDSSLHYVWDGASLVPATKPLLLSLSAISVDSALWTKGSLTVTGQRRLVVKQKGGSLSQYFNVEAVKLEVSWQAGDRPAARQLADALFFSGVDQAIAALPPSVHAELPILVPFSTPGDPPYPTCDCADKGTPACEERIAQEGVTKPKYSNRHPAIAPEDMREAHAGANTVRFFLDISEKGEIKEMWSAGPSEFAGVNRDAVTLIPSGRFKPFLCHGKPKEMTLLFILTYPAP